MSRFVQCGLCLLLLLTAGCDPYEWLTWSTDGEHAALIAGDGLRIAKASGEISAPVLKDVTRAVWLPQTSTIIAAQTEKFDKYSELKKALPDNDIQPIEAAARDFALALRKGGAPVESLVEATMRTRGLTEQQLSAAFLLLAETERPLLEEKLTGDYRAQLDELPKVTATSLQLIDVSVNPPKLTQTLTRTFGNIHDIVPAPNGKVIALLRESSGGAFDLYLLKNEANASPIRIAEHCARSIGWTKDSEIIAYARTRAIPIRPNSDCIATVRVLNIGTSWPPPTDLTDEQKHDDTIPTVSKDIVDVTLNEQFRLAWTSDDKLLFCCADVTYPRPTAETPKARLFTVDPAVPTTIAPLLDDRDEGSLGNRADIFALSPDGKHLCVPGEGGQITIVDMASKTVTELVHAQTDRKLHLAPVWRNNTDITYALGYQQSDSDRPAEIYVHPLNGDKVNLSHDWPDIALEKMKIKN